MPAFSGYGKKKMPSEEERVERYNENMAKLPAKQRRNVLGGTRSREIARMATGTAGMAVDPHRPHKRFKVK